MSAKPVSKYIALSLISGGVLALQIAFTRIFSLMIWHHFTYLVIGVALLGGGAAGAFLAVHQWDADMLRRRLGLLALCFSLVSLVNLLVIRFIAIDPLRAAQLAWSIVGLAIYVGSLVGQRVLRTAGQLRRSLLAVAAMVVLYIVALPPIFDALLRLPDLARILVTVLLVVPLSTVMGMPFPTGLRQLGERAPQLVPWAWGMNGVFSVVGSVMVILVSMVSSFTVALACAALCYVAAAGVAAWLWQVSMERAELGGEMAPHVVKGSVQTPRV